MRVIAAGPTLTPGRAAAGRVEFVTLDDLFPRADAVFICTRISDLTRGLAKLRLKPTSGACRLGGVAGRVAR